MPPGLTASAARQNSRSGYKALRSCLVLFLLAAVLPYTAHAVSVVWVLNGVTFNDGGTVNGSFTYDTTSNRYTNVNITTTTGSVRTGTTYRFVCGQDVPSCTGLAPNSGGMLNLTSTATNQTGMPGLALFFSPTLGVSGQVSVTGQEATCSDAACTAPGAPSRVVAASDALAIADVAFLVKYAANLQFGESFINIINDGAHGAPLLGPGLGGAVGNICVNVYAFDPNEELISCCSCLITPDQIRNLGVNRDVSANTATGVVPTSMTIKLLATMAGANGTGTSCTNSAALLPGSQLAGGFVAYGTTLHSQGNTLVTTETQFRTATLSAGEVSSLSNRCSFIIGNLSGFGICASCRTGALGAPKM